MANLGALFVALGSSLITLNLSLVNATFSKSVYSNWGSQQMTISGNGDDLQLMLNKWSGSGFQTKRKFLFGSIEMLIKLVPGNSAGTMSSTGATHDEIDFEFLGNLSGQPYTVHTNTFTHGVGNKEQQFHLWFDPTADFHNYTIHWNPSQIVWFVDGVPLRVFRNYESRGIAFPNQQGMRTYASIWDADNWATQGGRVKIDWNSAPFIARFQRFRARACKWNSPVSVSQCASITSANWWTSPVYSKLNNAQIGQMMWVRNNYMIYNYCTDTARFNGNMPPECYLQQY